jgi:hypothetical protein
MLNDLIKSVRNVVLLNALPLNAFSNPLYLYVVPINNNDALNIINTLKNSNANVKCYIGHAPTAKLLNDLGLSVNCVRAMWSFNNDADLIIVTVLKTRPATSGAGDIAVTLNDLLFYLVIPTHDCVLT